MSAYYPSSYGGGHHHGHHGSQVVYSNGGYMPSAGYGVQPGVVYVPPTSRSYSMGSRFPDDDYDSRSHRRRSRSFHRKRGRHDQRAYSYPNSYVYSGVPVSQVAAPMMVQQPSYGAYQQQGYYPQQHRWTFGQRMRLFFGLAPTPAFKYKSDKNSWGFMGYSKRRRFVDPRTGGEVDRDGRPVMRV